MCRDAGPWYWASGADRPFLREPLSQMCTQVLGPLDTARTTVRSGGAQFVSWSLLTFCFKAARLLPTTLKTDDDPVCTNVASSGFSASHARGKPGTYYLGVFKAGAAPAHPSALLLADNVATVVANNLHPSTMYTLRWRFRPANPTINFGFGWSGWEAPFECKTLAAAGGAERTVQRAPIVAGAKSLQL